MLPGFNRLFKKFTETKEKIPSIILINSPTLVAAHKQ